MKTLSTVLLAVGLLALPAACTRSNQGSSPSEQRDTSAPGSSPGAAPSDQGGTMGPSQSQPGPSQPGGSPSPSQQPGSSNP